MGDYRELLAAVGEQIDAGIKLAGNISLPKNTKRILYCGMGGSGIAGDILSALGQQNGLDIIVYKGSELPAYLVSNDTVVVISSYSGNTAETLACYRSATKLKARMFIMASGGVLLASAQRQKIPYVNLPGSYLPRQALMFQLFAMIQLLVNSDLLPSQTTAINEFKQLLADYPFARRSNAIAKSIDNLIPVIYSSPALACAAIRWRTQMNENAKTLCFTNVFTELNHNEIEGYDAPVKNDSLIVLKREHEPKLVEQQMSIFCQLARSQVDSLKDFDIPGRSTLASLLVAIHLGDWVSYQLAELKGRDPDPVAMITQLKSQLT